MNMNKSNNYQEHVDCGVVCGKCKFCKHEYLAPDLCKKSEEIRITPEGVKYRIIGETFDAYHEFREKYGKCPYFIKKWFYF